MRRRKMAFPVVLVIAIGVAVSTPMSLGGQAKPDGHSGTSTMSRLPDGQPDIQGTWLNFDSTPFEQGPSMPRHDEDVRALGIGGPRVWPGHAGPIAAKRPSMVVDPPNGRVPVLPWAETKRDYDIAHIQDSWLHMTPWERCITRGVPGGMFPTGYNNGYQIVQGPGVVAILYEMIHEPRIIPVDGSPHLPSNIRLWNGDSRGRWEGNTLVVDITNYTDKGAIANNMASERIRNIAQSEQLHVVERFTRISADRMDYSVTITDPKVYTAPWTVAMPLTRDDSYQIFEYACHEGDLGRENTLSGGRAKEKANANK